MYTTHTDHSHPYLPIISPPPRHPPPLAPLVLTIPVVLGPSEMNQGCAYGHGLVHLLEPGELSRGYTAERASGLSSIRSYR